MTPERAEFWLAILYISSMTSSIISVISLVTVWQHWAWTLDTYSNIDCSCILYGTNTQHAFIGSNAKFCYFGTCGLIPAIIIGLCLGGFHGYRACIYKNLDKPKRTSGKQSYDDDARNLNGQAVVVNVKKRSPCKQWILAAFCTALICCLSFAHAIVITDGYFKTCEQYKRKVVQLLGSSGREVQAIHNRLSCGAIFDFMDYIQPDANNWRRGTEINTGIALYFATTMSWLNVFFWFVACVINIIMARKRVQNLGEKFCCC